MLSQKIYLVQAPFFHSSRPGINTPLWPPLSIGLIASTLREAGYQVIPVDLNIEFHRRKFQGEKGPAYCSGTFFRDENKVRQYLTEDNELEAYASMLLGEHNFYEASLILLSSPRGMDFSSQGSAVCLARYLKKNHKADIILGGCWHLPEIFKSALIEGVVDYACQGPGEAFVLEFLQRRKNGHQVEDIPGICFRDNKTGKVITCGAGEEVDLHLPDFDGLPLSHYVWHPGEPAELQHSWYGNGRKAHGVLVLPFRFQLGCSGTCAFCACGQGHKMKLLPAREAAALVVELSRKYHTPFFRFAHNAINPSYSYTREFCEALVSSGEKLQNVSFMPRGSMIFSRIKSSAGTPETFATIPAKGLLLFDNQNNPVFSFYS